MYDIVGIKWYNGVHYKGKAFIVPFRTSNSQHPAYEIIDK